MRAAALRLGVAALVLAVLTLAGGARGTGEATARGPAFGGTLLFTSDADGDVDLYAVAARGGRVYALSRNYDSEQVSARGATVARAWREWVFVLRRDGRWRRLARGGAGLYEGAVFDHGRRVVVEQPKAVLVMTPRGKLVRRIALPAGARSVAPDARHVAFQVTPAKGRRAGVFVTSVVTGKTRRLAGGSRLQPASWSPDGSVLLLGGDGYRLAAVRWKRPTVRVAGRLDYWVWSPDGRALALEESVGERHTVTVVDTRSLRRRSWSVESMPTHLVWSPDGSRLAYGQGTAGGVDVVVAQVRAGSRRTVARLASLQQGPEWSPDGGRLVYVEKAESAPREKWTLATVAASGGPARALMRGDPVGFLAWDRDGSRLLFATPGRVGSVGVEGRVHGSVPVSFDKAGDVLNLASQQILRSPDGRAVAFTAGYGGESVYVLATNGKQIGRLTRRGHDRIIAWLPTPVLRRARVAPTLPASERASARLLDTRAPVVAVSADGAAAGVLVAAHDLDGIHAVVWRPGGGLARVGTPAPYTGEAEVSPFDVELTAEAIRWSSFSCGNDCYLSTYRAARAATDIVSYVGEDTFDDAPVWPLPPAETRRGVVATTGAGAVRLRRLADGAERVVTVAGARIFDAELEDEGLFYAVNYRHGEFEGRVRFVPFDRLFGSGP